MWRRLGHSARGAMAVLGLLVGGGVVGAVTATIVVDDPATGTEGTATGSTTASSDASLAPDGPLTCATYDIPTLGSAVTPRPTLLDGLPYVIVCEDSADREVLSEAFIYRTPPHCSWTSDVDEPVLPPSDLGLPPTPDSVMIVEMCGGDPTGNIAWSQPHE